MMKALIVAGSRTPENAYGEISGRRVAESLLRRGWEVDLEYAVRGQSLLRKLLDSPPDIVVPVGFGAPTEDGQIHALAHLAGVPCAGPTPAAGTLMMDKRATAYFVNSVFPAGSGVRAPRGCDVTKFMPLDEVNRRVISLQSPLVVKPNYGGSSIGLQLANSTGHAVSVALGMCNRDGRVLIQEFLSPAREFSVTLLDTKVGTRVLPIVELRKDGALLLGVEEKFGARARDRHVVPAPISPDLEARILETVLLLHRSLGARGLARVDLLLFGDELVILEVNGIPGLLPTSIACDAAVAAGISFDELAEIYALSAFLPVAEPFGAVPTESEAGSSIEPGDLLDSYGDRNDPKKG